MAELIERRRTDEQRELNTAIKRVIRNHEEHKHAGTYLTEKQLSAIEPLKDKLAQFIEPEHLTFIEESREHNDKISQEKEKQLKKEIRLRAKAETSEKKVRQQFRWILGIVALSLILAALAFLESIRANQEKENALASKKLADSTAVSLRRALDIGQVLEDSINKSDFRYFFDLGLEKIESEKYEGAIVSLDAALKFDASKQDSVELMIAVANDKMGNRATYESNMSRGKSAADSGQWGQALKLFIAASNLPVSPTQKEVAFQKAEECRAAISTAFTTLVDSAVKAQNAERCEDALTAVQRAMALYPYLEAPKFQVQKRDIERVQEKCGQ